MDYPPSLLAQLRQAAEERIRRENYKRAEWTRIAVNADSNTWLNIADDME